MDEMTLADKFLEFRTCIRKRIPVSHDKVKTFLEDPEFLNCISRPRIKTCKKLGCTEGCQLLHSPLHVAVTWDSVPFIRVLIQAGANINCIEVTSGKRRSLTPLHVAVINERPQTVEFLLECGADSSIAGTDSKGDFEDKTPLEVAENKKELKKIADIIANFQSSRVIINDKIPDLRKRVSALSDIRIEKRRKLNEWHQMDQELTQQEQEKKKALGQTIQGDIASTKQRHLEWIRLNHELECKKESLVNLHDIILRLEHKLKELQKKKKSEEICQERILLKMSALERQGCSEELIGELIQHSMNLYESEGSSSTERVKRDALECFICTIVPCDKKIFSCDQCGQFACQSCVGNFESTQCPFCRKYSRDGSMVRNKAMEKLIRNCY